MSALHGKTIIGLTGNIATGKSVVRRMLEHLGAYGIDADSLSHRAIAKGAPGYQTVIDNFGNFILDDEGEIDRAKLGKLVFADPEALKQLESIVHPLVRQGIDHLVQRSKHNVVVIEAIKLLESPLRQMVDSVWVTTASEEMQLERLVRKRGMPKETAVTRIRAQGPQERKVKAADYVIYNKASYDETWQQVRAAWKALMPEGTGPVAVSPSKPAPTTEIDAQKLTVVRARPDKAADIASFVTRISGGKQRLDRDAVMAAFGEKAFLLLMASEKMVGLVGWQVENLVARVDDVYLEPGLSVAAASLFLITEVEEASKELQAEAALVFVTPELAKEIEVWTGLGYEVRKPETLTINAWKEAAHNFQANGHVMLFKQLRVDRVLRPM
ncbi:MAG: dephospho-CoA kinase [Chloroflexi bacterium]|nr:MAG: dephospho-CoA kinase [Chloroflexota bacterium]MBL1197131.1 dephospho-CoA kinase [Chloroflexota bacterium]NOH14426.1 dephospho-CoA kinase [Chloroflexota bacterium]